MRFRYSCSRVARCVLRLQVAALSSPPPPLSHPLSLSHEPHVRMSSPNNNSDAIVISRPFIQPLFSAPRPETSFPTIRILSRSRDSSLFSSGSPVSPLSCLLVVGYGSGNRRLFFVSAPGFSQISSPSSSCSCVCDVMKNGRE